MNGWNQSRKMNVLGKEINALLVRAPWSQNLRPAQKTF